MGVEYRPQQLAALLALGAGLEHRLSGLLYLKQGCGLLGPSGAAIHSLEGHLMPLPGHCLKVARKLVYHPWV